MRLEAFIKIAQIAKAGFIAYIDDFPVGVCKLVCSIVEAQVLDIIGRCDAQVMLKGTADMLPASVRQFKQPVDAKHQIVLYGNLPAKPVQPAREGFVRRSGQMPGK